MKAQRVIEDVAVLGHEKAYGKVDHKKLMNTMTKYL